MTEEGKNHFDLYKYLCFPWGWFAATPLWFVIIKAIEPFLNGIEFTNSAGETAGIPWWCSWVIFAVGEIGIFVFLAVYSYSIPKGKKTGITSISSSHQNRFKTTSILPVIFLIALSDVQGVR